MIPKRVRDMPAYTLGCATNITKDNQVCPSTTPS